MSELGRHLAFVIAAYGVSAVVLVGMTVWTFLAYHRQRRAVAEAEARRALVREARRA